MKAKKSVLSLLLCLVLLAGLLPLSALAADWSSGAWHAMWLRSDSNVNVTTEDGRVTVPVRTMILVAIGTLPLILILPLHSALGKLFGIDFDATEDKDGRNGASSEWTPKNEWMPMERPVAGLVEQL